MIKGELTIKEYPQAEVYKWVASFVSDDGRTFDSFATTRNKALNRLASKIDSTYDKS